MVISCFYSVTLRSGRHDAGRSGWNTLRVGGAIPDDELTEAIDASYTAVVSKLPKKDRPA